MVPFPPNVRRLVFLLSLKAVLVVWHWPSCHGLSTRTTTLSPTTDSANLGNINNILILDHINMNHGKGRHDWLKAFYGDDFLGCAWDPRKAKNLEAGHKTLWANIGAHQFHLPEGSPDAQVLNGEITIVHPTPEKLLERYNTFRSNASELSRLSCLNNSKFHVEEVSPKGDESTVIVTDPWGSIFRIVPETKKGNLDPRGKQPGKASEGLALSDLTIHVPMDSNLEGIGRFYEEILGAKLAANDEIENQVQIQMGPFQTLTFVPKESVEVNTHVDLREMVDETDGTTEEHTNSAGTSTNLGNYGVHISLYVADLPKSYQKARGLGLAYVNTRFSRRAYTLEEAIGDCMFRCLDIVDPLHPEDGPILRLEHEVRSVVKKDGSKYKSCPFDEIPDSCVTL